MKTPNPIHRVRHAGLTRTGLFFAIVVVLVLVWVATPVFREASRKGRLTHSLSCGKQIGTAMKMYAADHEEKFPSTKLDGTPLGSADFSNRAFEQLMPKYSSTKKLFLNKPSAWCRNPAKDKTAADETLLKHGQNDWIYVAGHSEKSDARWPLVATATASATDLTYSNVTSAKGGVWGGTDAIVTYIDGSAKCEPCIADPTDKTKTFLERPDKPGANLFIATPVEITTILRPEWLGPARVILAPE
jgi:hypothetical protein